MVKRRKIVAVVDDDPGMSRKALCVQQALGSAPELRSAVVALSLGGLRRKIEALLLPAEVEIVLQLDGLAERERHRRQAQA
jgi:hypothetical protein